MNRLEETQYHAGHIMLLDGVETDSGGPDEAPCFICGDMVNLLSPITFVVTEADGHTEMKVIPEKDARQIMGQCGIDPPPVCCNKHEGAV